MLFFLQRSGQCVLCPWVRGVFQQLGLWGAVLPPAVGLLCRCSSLFLVETVKQEWEKRLRKGWGEEGSLEGKESLQGEVRNVSLISWQVEGCAVVLLYICCASQSS